MGGTVNGAIAHCGIALNLADQCADSLYAENIGADQVDIFDRGTFAYIAEQADVASGGDLQPGDLVPVAIKGALKRCSAVADRRPSIGKFDIPQQLHRAAILGCFQCSMQIVVSGYTHFCNRRRCRLRCPRGGGDAEYHDQRQNGCQYFFHCNTPHRNLYFRRPHRFNKIVIKTQCNDVVADTLIIASIFRLSTPFCKFYQILSCVHRKIVKYFHFLPFLPRQKQEAARPPASLSQFIFRS